MIAKFNKKVFIGVGLLTLPYNAKLVGPIFSIILTIYIGILTYTSYNLVLEMADKERFRGNRLEIFCRTFNW